MKNTTVAATRSDKYLRAVVTGLYLLFTGCGAAQTPADLPPANDGPAWDLTVAAKDPSTSPDRLTEIFAACVESNPMFQDCRMNLAMNPHTPLEVLAQLHQDLLLAQVIKFNPAAQSLTGAEEDSPEHLSELADNTEASVRSKVAENHFAPRAVLDKLASDTNQACA